jgi:DNA-binding response OmpR family regulator
VKAKILFVEDDVNLGFVTKDNLEMSGYEVVHCLDGKSAADIFLKENFDICVFDVMLPELDGFELAKLVRKNNTDIPVIFLTAKSLKEDKLYGLRIGADDYLTKPFSIEELLLKIDIFLKRSGFKIPPENLPIYLGIYSFDFQNLSLAADNKVQTLTYREGELLDFLIKNKNKVVPRDEILNKIWGDDSYFNGRSLDVFISRLRKYLKDDPNVRIENIHSVGFRLSVSA